MASLVSALEARAANYIWMVQRAGDEELTTDVADRIRLRERFEGKFRSVSLVVGTLNEVDGASSLFPEGLVVTEVAEV